MKSVSLFCIEFDWKIEKLELTPDILSVFHLIRFNLSVFHHYYTNFTYHSPY
jgi:hypothetical protein